MNTFGFNGKPRRLAVSVVNATKTYSTKQGANPILKNLTMTVECGKIYSLLGSSGCGKTTLLSCVTGMRKLNSGEILVFGKTPGSEDCGVPGRRIGFMPQEIALHAEFSIAEELHYFGKIYGMSRPDVEDNTKFLVNFLKLPPSHRRISSLSGGQQRRVSFAVALVHNPELLILDEPTVGVDPLLRQSIWRHLVKLANSSGTSIIITTHFIEEARDSHRIGLMRNGRLLMEDTPMALMEKYNTNILEEIVVELCLKDNTEEDAERDPESLASTEGFRIKVTSPSLLPPQIPRHVLALSANAPISTRLGITEPLQVPAPVKWPSLGQVLHRAMIVEMTPTPLTKKKQLQKKGSEKLERITALLLKNVLVLTRNLMFVMFLVVLPAFEVITVCLAIGADPRGIHLGVINHEIGFEGKCETPAAEVGCLMSSSLKYKTRASCEFIRALDPQVFGLVKYQKEEEALRDVKLGKLWGVMTFPPNFTEQLKERLQYGTFAGLEVLLASRIYFTLDMSSKQIGLLIQKNILESFRTFMQMTAKGCKIEVEGVDLPVYFGPPAFGTLTTSFTEYIAPGVILAITFFFPMCSAAMSMIMEKSSGALERTLVAGVTTQEIMISHFLTQFVLLLFQATSCFLLVFLPFKIDILGSITLAFIMTLLVGVVGISFGFVIAAVCRNELESVLMTIAVFMPNLILAGIIWPLEGMPDALRLFSQIALPCTMSSLTLRSIITRGSPFFHPTVWPGFLITTGYIFLYWFTALGINRLKNKH